MELTSVSHQTIMHQAEGDSRRHPLDESVCISVCISMYFHDEYMKHAMNVTLGTRVGL